MDLASNPATDMTFSLGQAWSLSPSGIVLVTTIWENFELQSLRIAGPDRTGVGSTGHDFPGAVREQCFGCLNHGPCGVDHIVDKHADLAINGLR